jgi:hypothetical protein
MKAYIAKQSSRTIPVGYSAADVSENRLPLAEYLNCGDDSTRGDFYAFNNYAWCGNSSYTYSSGFDLTYKLDNPATINVSLNSQITLSPSFSASMAVISCNPVSSLKSELSVTPLKTKLIPDSTEMTSVFSGGLVYEWSQEISDYGLVDLSNNNITLLQDYINLKNEFAATSLPSGDGGYKSGGQASTCPGNSTDFTSWAILPAMPAAAQIYIDNGAGQALGFKGPSNQGAGATASAPVSAGTNTATGTSCPSCTSGSSNSTSGGHVLLLPEKGVAGGAILAAVAAIVGAMVII